MECLKLTYGQENINALNLRVAYQSDSLNLCGLKEKNSQKLRFDYYPFGMIMLGRNFNANAYRFGFNGQEKDDEWTGSTGSHLDFGARIYDSRVARFLSTDPAWKAYPQWSPYLFAANNPIKFIDEYGEGPGDGEKRLYVTKKTITTAKGVEKTVYLKKWYYKNATPRQVARYTSNATSGGWLKSNEYQYKRYQKDPTQGDFHSKMLGADTPSMPIEMIGETGLGAPKGLAGSQSGIIKFKTTGVDHDGNTVTGDATLTVYDSEGNIVSTNTLSYSGDEELEFDINLKDGQYFTMDNSNQNVTGSEYGAFTKEKKGEERLDNWDDYKTEEPTEEDAKEILGE